MTSALDSLVGVIPVVVVGGVVMKITERLFPTPKQTRKLKKTRKTKLGFGNFRNLGL